MQPPWPHGRGGLFVLCGDRPPFRQRACYLPRAGDDTVEIMRPCAKSHGDAVTSAPLCSHPAIVARAITEGAMTMVTNATTASNLDARSPALAATPALCAPTLLTDEEFASIGGGLIVVPIIPDPAVGAARMGGGAALILRALRTL